MTFGYELEFLNARLDFIGKKYHLLFQKRGATPLDYKNFVLQTEYKVTQEGLKGGELISPVYQNYDLCLKELKEKLEILKENKARIEKNSEETSFQVSLSRDIFDNDFERYYAFFLFWLTFQNEIFYNAKGKEPKIRETSKMFASPLNRIMIERFLHKGSIRAIHDKFWAKDFCIRFSKDLPLVEFRPFNSSLEYVVLKSHIDFSLRLGIFIKKKKYDLEKIEFMYKYGNVIKGNSNSRVRQHILNRMLEPIDIKKEMTN